NGSGGKANQKRISEAALLPPEPHRPTFRNATRGIEFVRSLPRRCAGRPSGLARIALFRKRQRRVGLKWLLRIEPGFEFVDVRIKDLMNFWGHDRFGFVQKERDVMPRSRSDNMLAQRRGQPKREERDRKAQQHALRQTK